MNQNLIKKLSIVAILLFAGVLFHLFRLESYFSLEYIKASQEQFQALYSQYQLLIISAYFLLYVLVTAFSLPGTAVLTLTGGALFGFWIGVATVSFASTIGATLACMVARFVFRDWVQEKFGDKLTPINEGVEKEGAFYLFTMRLVPIFPFFVINLLMGLTRMPLRTFYWVSQAGMLAGTAVFVNAGKELAKIDSLAGILSPSLLISFIILGVFPIMVKRILGIYRSKSGQLAAV
ncbi:TVP38/TMEM64 family protein [Thermodesulfobacteriota bacterium]